ncbi:MAG: SDR family NAD(P)-dependent oxidoreductase [Alphaproteobacteria bacterium]|nr:SDR family NAD(P)-dependent oxidoreductase [Alphaproteobacteria bacterium]
MKNKIALITGASRGLGRSVAKSLAKKGVELILVARTISALEELDDEIKSIGSKSTIVPMDLEDNEAIDVLGGEIHKKWGKLDILVSSAATVGEVTPVSHLDPKIWNKVINLNLSVNFRLIRSFEPLLKKSNQSYAIFISDNNSKLPKPFWAPYNISKLGLETLIEIWKKEITRTNIKAIIFEPGDMKTAMRASFMPGEKNKNLNNPEDISETIMKLIKF